MDTPTSNTSTLWQERNIQNRLVVAQAETDFSWVQQSLNTPKVPIEVVSHDSDSIDLEKCRDGGTARKPCTFENTSSSTDAKSAAGIKYKDVGVT